MIYSDISSHISILTFSLTISRINQENSGRGSSRGLAECLGSKSTPQRNRTGSFGLRSFLVLSCKKKIYLWQQKTQLNTYQIYNEWLLDLLGTSHCCWLRPIYVYIYIMINVYPVMHLLSVQLTYEVWTKVETNFRTTWFRKSGSKLLDGVAYPLFWHKLLWSSYLAWSILA